jgi:subtilisin-like proprotein convertase family protein
LGAISNGEFDLVEITATPASIGVLTNVWSVTNTLGVDDNLANNSSTVQVSVTLPRPIITNGPATLLSQGAPPFNGAINPNQTNTVAFTLVNTGTAATASLVATLQANPGIRPITTTASYGAIAPGGGTASQPYAFVGTGGSGAAITAELSLQDGNTNLGSVDFTFVMPVTQSFTNASGINIPYIGPGSPYPSSILVAGLTNAVSNMLVAKVTATLLGFAHTWPHDVEAELVSPAGQGVMLMEHTGAFYSVTNVVLTFDSTDTSAQNLSSNSSLASGTFLPTAYSPFDTLPGLALVPAGDTNLDLFNGTNPNGLWSLYVYDDTQGNEGVITGGWSLALTSVSPVNITQVTTAPASWTNAVVSGGVFQATLVGSLGQRYAIQSSSNLVNWTAVSTNAGTFVFTNTTTSAPQMFYRAIQLSP